jgi:hypothetical protein
MTEPKKIILDYHKLISKVKDEYREEITKVITKLNKKYPEFVLDGVTLNYEIAYGTAWDNGRVILSDIVINLKIQGDTFSDKHKPQIKDQETGPVFYKDHMIYVKLHEVTPVEEIWTLATTIDLLKNTQEDNLVVKAESYDQALKKIKQLIDEITAN